MEGTKIKRKLTQTEINCDGIPQIWKSVDLKKVAIVYEKRVEYYQHSATYRGEKKLPDDSQADYTPDNEIQMLRGNGFRRVRNRDIRIIHDKIVEA